MSNFNNLYVTMPDGTLKHKNPLSGTEVWTVPGRAHRPQETFDRPKQKLIATPIENYCDFCAANYFKTPPEKSRLITLPHHAIEKQVHLPACEIKNGNVLFRRIGNLFEIITYAYWSKNYGYKLTSLQQQWKESYLSLPEGYQHVIQMVDTKLKLGNKTEKEIANLPIDEKLSIADAFFGGSHELIIVGKHYAPEADFDDQLLSSGNLSPEEHYQFIKFTIDAMVDIYENNRYVRYVTIFQNWLKPAGASFNHLHKQLVGIDEWGSSVELECSLVNKNPNIYNDAIINFSIFHNLVFAENDYAIALSEIGHRYPTLAIYSKSTHARPEEHTDNEIRGFSDILHACHAAMGTAIPCNEEWYFSPKDALSVMPWHVLIKWRTINQAGFEGGTKIYINPVSPEALRDKIVPALYTLRQEKKIAPFQIATECRFNLNSLLYYQK